MNTEQVQMYDTGAPRGERNYFYVKVRGEQVFGSYNRAQCTELKDALRAALEKPIDTVLHCPKCDLQHIDEADDEGMVLGALARGDQPWRNPPHKSHLCAECGTIWRPADVCTNGVPSVVTRGAKDSWPPR